MKCEFDDENYFGRYWVRLDQSLSVWSAVMHHSIGTVLERSAACDRGSKHVFDLQGGLEVGISRLWEGRHTRLRMAQSQGVEKHITGR